MITLPCLSIRQPWAWLIVNGHKDVENRTWPTRVRGMFFVHASNTMTRADYEACAIFCGGLPFDVPLPPAGDLERGGIVGVAVLTDCVGAWFSPWFTGPYGFVLANPMPRKFRPYKGHLGFFDVPIDASIPFVQCCSLCNNSPNCPYQGILNVCRAENNWAHFQERI